MKSKCNVAKDLMPLCIDGVASEESQQYVDDHIAECTECALTYGAMRVELPRISAEKERVEMEKAAKAMKKKRRKRVVWSAVIGAVLSIVLFVGSEWLYHRLTQSMQYPMEKDELTVEVYKRADGTGLVVFDLAQDDAVCGIGMGYGNGIANLYMYEPAIQQGSEKYEKNYGGYRTYEIGFLDERGWMNISEWMWMGGSRDGKETLLERNQEAIKEIWMNYGDGQELIYKHGDEVPNCSPEMEAYLDYFQQQASYGKPVEYDYDKLAELRNAVPEWYGGKPFVEKYVCENGDLRLEALYYDVSQQTGDLRVQVDIHSFPSGNPYFHTETEAVVINNGTAICVQYRAVYDEEESEYSGTGVMYWTGQIKDGEWVMSAMELRNEDGSVGELPIVRLELHAGDDYVVLWEEGDVLQTPSEAMSKREAEEAKYTTK